LNQLESELDPFIPKTEEDMVRFMEAVQYSWEINRRPEQWPDPDTKDWHTWMYLGGRGAGKTRSGSELVRYWIMNGTYKRGHLIAPTVADLRDVMVEGPSGLLNVFPPWFRPTYEPSKRKVSFPNGAVILLYSADQPERLRGPQCDFLWGDEVASWRRPDTWDMAMFGLRLGENPRAIVTGTPKPTKLIKKLLTMNGVLVTRGSTYANEKNLAPQFLRYIKEKYEGTRLGRQEIFAEMLDDNPSALWSRETIEQNRVNSIPAGLKMVRVLTAVDPSTQDDKNSDEAGIITGFKGGDKHYYILDDSTIQASPLGWAKKAISCYSKFNADRIIYESNQGGLMVEATFANIDKKIPLKGVHASRGKVVRAEPISALYEKGLVHHVGYFPELEDEMCQWEPGMDSPNRMDALVWLVTALHGGSGIATAMTGYDVRPA
jgi:phage terminase large subunit-like protein